MSIKKFMYAMTMCLVVIGCMVVHVEAVDNRELKPVLELEIPRATQQFDVEISGNSIAAVITSLSLEYGDIVEINVFFSPKFADIKIGLIAPDGRFYGLESSDGEFKHQISVEERGYYTLAIQNKSSYEVAATGFVRY